MYVVGLYSWPTSSSSSSSSSMLTAGSTLDGSAECVARAWRKGSTSAASAGSRANAHELWPDSPLSAQNHA